MKSETTPSTYRPDIDGLRAVAVLSVLLFHAGYRGFSGGFVGVDVFFVISGFVITRTILRDIRESRFSFIEFYARRVRRIFPGLLLIIVALLVAGWFLLVPADYEALAKEAIAGAFFVPNFLFWSEAGYFDKAAELKPLLHLWSLGIEEQFYLIWPAAVFFIARRRQVLLGFLFIVTAASFAWCVYLTSTNHVAAFYLPFSRVWELSLGGLVALAGWEPANQHIRSSLFVTGLVAIAVAVLTFRPGQNFPGAIAAIPTLGAAAVIWTAGNSPLSRYSLALKPVAYIGLISYPLYLWHWPLISLARSLSWQIPVAALLAVSTVLAIATYEFLERRLRKISPTAVARPFLAGMATVAIGSYAIFTTGGVYSRYPSEVASILRTMKYDYGTDGRLYTCWFVDERGRQDFPPECTAPVREGGVLIVGDSHAARLYPGLKAAFENTPVWQITRSSCLPIGGSFECNRTRDYALGIAERQKPRFVILFAAWVNYSPDWNEGTALATSLGSTIEQFARTGTQVVVLGPAPIWKPSLPNIAYGEWKRTGHVPARGNGVDSNVGIVDEQIRSIAQHHHARFVSVNNLLCDNTGCVVHVPKEPGKLLSWDTGHLTTAGAEYLAALLSMRQVFVPLPKD